MVSGGEGKGGGRRSGGHVRVWQKTRTGLAHFTCAASAAAAGRAWWVQSAGDAVFRKRRALLGAQRSRPVAGSKRRGLRPPPAPTMLWVLQQAKPLASGGGHLRMLSCLTPGSQ